MANINYDDPEFKVWDEVVCIDSYAATQLKDHGPGYVYTIKEIKWHKDNGRPLLDFTDGTSGWYAYRFQLASAARAGKGLDPSLPYPDPEADALRAQQEALVRFRRETRQYLGMEGDEDGRAE